MILNFSSSANFAASVPEVVPMGGTTAEGLPPLMAVMEVVAVQARSPEGVLVLKLSSCLACMMVSCMSLKVESGCIPGGSGEYPLGKVWLPHLLQLKLKPQLIELR